MKLTATGNGDGMVTTYNVQGQELVQLLPTAAGQNGMVVTFNAKGQEMVRAGATEGGRNGVVTTFNDQGEVAGSIVICEP